MKENIKEMSNAQLNQMLSLIKHKVEHQDLVQAIELELYSRVFTKHVISEVVPPIDLQKALDKAVAEERYEDAELIKQQINKPKQGR
jgi:hypothetical protein